MTWGLQYVCSQTTVSFIGTILLNKTAGYDNMSWIIFISRKPIRKWNSMKPNVIPWGRHDTLSPNKLNMSIYFDHNQTLEQVKSAQYFDITIIGISECQIFLLCRYTKILGFIHRNFSLQSRETKEVAYKTLVCWNTQPSLKSIYSGQTEKVQKIAARWTCRRWQNMPYWRDTGWIAVASTGSPARACFSCILPQKSIQMLDTLKYLTSAPGLRQIRASHDSQHPSYTNALKFFFSFPKGIRCLLM